VTQTVIFDKGLAKERPDGAFGAVLAAVALSQIARATEEAGRYLASCLRPVAARLEALLAEPRLVSAAESGSLHHALGLTLNVIGEQTVNNSTLAEAIAAYRSRNARASGCRCSGRGLRTTSALRSRCWASGRAGRSHAGPMMPPERLSLMWSTPLLICSRMAFTQRGRGKTHLQRTAGGPLQSDCGRVCALIQALRPGSPAAAVRHQ
jgi:hypothetical protein